MTPVDSVGCPNGIGSHDPVLSIYNGKMFNLVNPNPDDIDSETIAHALSMQCRFNGHVHSFISVAQHSVNVHDGYVEEFGPGRGAFAALMHDASEAYLGDMVRDLKRYDRLAAFVEIEDALQTVIARRFGLHDYDKYHAGIKKWDNRCLKAEVLNFHVTDGHDWGDEFQALEPYPTRKMTSWSPTVAKIEFLTRFQAYERMYSRSG